MRAGRHRSPVVCTNLFVTTVGPLEKTDHVKTIDPTRMDMLMLDSFVPVFFAYRLADNGDALYEHSVNRIKEGLRKVLVPFFPWAGRWIAVSEGWGRQLQCNDEGVPFIEAYVDQNLDSVVRVSHDFQPVLELQGYSVLGMNATQLRHPMLPDGLPCAFVQVGTPHPIDYSQPSRPHIQCSGLLLPVIAILLSDSFKFQVTRFKCGGLVVAVTFNHMLADGKSFFDFIQAWSDLSRTNKTEILCDHNRAAVDPSIRATLPPDTSTTRAYIPPPKWEVKSYEVSASVIASLKSEVKMRAEGVYVSTMDCISAHLWKTLSSLPFSVIGGKGIAMVNAVDGRTRFYDPPMPNLLGNMVVSMRAPNISTAELLKMPLSVIATKIREKIITTSRERWLSAERAAEALDAFTNDKVLPWGLTCWNSFPVYKIDFGFGNPFFSPGLNNSFSWEMFGLTYVGPPTPGVCASAAFIVIRSTKQLLDALEHHPVFLPFFLPDDGYNFENSNRLGTTVAHPLGTTIAQSSNDDDGYNFENSNRLGTTVAHPLGTTIAQSFNDDDGYNFENNNRLGTTVAHPLGTTIAQSFRGCCCAIV